MKTSTTIMEEVMGNINEIKLSGKIHKLYRLTTKAGGPMAKVLLKVGKDTFWVLSYGNVADAIGRLDEGDELAILDVHRDDLEVVKDVEIGLFRVV